MGDKIKYHLYNEHYEDFIRCSDSVPRILKKSLAASKSEHKATTVKVAKENTVSKPSALARIFRKKEQKKILSVLLPKRSNKKDISKLQNSDSQRSKVKSENIPSLSKIIKKS